MMKVAIKKLSDNATVPTYGSEFAAGADLYSAAGGPVEIPAHETRVIPTGIAVELPVGYAGLIYARSGLATKRGLAPANKVGVVDCDYRGEVKVALHNHSGVTQTIAAGERIAQFIITPYITAQFVVCDELSDTARGEGGFGSTGTK
ncbi:MAG: dUTP diphosphatase [Clostridia bacterium]|nr:dUTP diphosphatase [Clostridia bacterium]